MSVRISATVITFNEEKNIDRCLRSLHDVVDEIVIIDSYSSDATKEICSRYNNVIFTEHPFEGHIEQKNIAVQRASHNVILSLDADEELSKELTASIIDVKSNMEANAYSFNRLNNFGGRWIRHCGWYPDKKIRLFDKKTGHWAGTNPHDRVELIPGTEVKHLQGDLLHYSYTGLWDHVARSTRYAQISSEALFKNGKSTTLVKVIFSPLFRFVKDYFLKMGFMDGLLGLHISLTSAYSTFVKYYGLYLKKTTK